jgi:sugar phosphate isomerase/epimerase
VTELVHHVEIWVADLARTVQQCEPLMLALGAQRYQDWERGRSWRRGGSYVVVEQSPDLRTDVRYDRVRAGLNHLALRGTRAAVDAALAAGWTVRVDTGEAVHLLDGAGFEVEVVLPVSKRAYARPVTAPAPWRLADADWNSWPDGLLPGTGDDAVWRQAARLRLEGVELGVYDAAVELAPSRLDALAALAADTGIPVAAVLLSLPADRWPRGALSGDVDRLLEQVRACAAACRALGLGVLGLWPGADPPGADVVDTLRTVVETAGEVQVAVEYKPATAVATADDALALCEAVDGLGVLLDTGHAFALGEDPARVVARLGDRLLHVHLGDAALGEGDDDLPCGRLHDFVSLVAALDAGFTGTASFDLYGAVSSGLLSGAQAVRESRDHMLTRRA